MVAATFSGFGMVREEKGFWMMVFRDTGVAKLCFAEGGGGKIGCLGAEPQWSLEAKPPEAEDIGLHANNNYCNNVLTNNRIFSAWEFLKDMSPL